MRKTTNLVFAKLAKHHFGKVMKPNADRRWVRMEKIHADCEGTNLKIPR